MRAVVGLGQGPTVSHLEDSTLGGLEWPGQLYHDGGKRFRLAIERVRFADLAGQRCELELTA